MGSWIALSMLKNELIIDGLILSGSSKFPKLLIAAQKLIIKVDILFNGRKKINNIMETLTTKRFNNYFKPNRTASDWISTDKNNVDNYVQDELCGYKVTNGLWIDMAQGIEDSFKINDYKNINKNIPVLIISGSEDPVGLSPLTKILKSNSKRSANETALPRLFDGRESEVPLGL